MASATEREQRTGDKDPKIPLLTVQKNGTLLKNILLNSPPLQFASELKDESERKLDKSYCEKFLLGRHPDCHIVLDHPSISRFHIEIHSKPWLQKIYVIDLSSVHGTWISDQKIKPRSLVELEEGDTLKFGTSTRIYRLKWVSSDQILNIDNSLISPVAIPEEKEDENLITSVAPTNTMNPYLSQEEVFSGVENMIQNENNNDIKEINPHDMWLESPDRRSVIMWSPLRFNLQDETQSPSLNRHAEVSDTEDFLCGRENDISSETSEKQNKSRSTQARKHSDEVTMISFSDARRNKEEMNVENDKICKILFCGLKEEDGVYLSGKENMMSPRVFNSRKKGTPEIMPLGMHKSPFAGLLSVSDTENDTILLDKENLTPMISKSRQFRIPTSHSVERLESEIKKKRGEQRLPFKPLILNSIASTKSVSVLNSMSRGSINDKQRTSEESKKYSNQSDLDFGMVEKKKTWNMVIDTSCFLCDESRRALKQLEGLLGTHLIIPRMVIRELDCLKRRGNRSQFLKEASSALEWIEKCMVKKRWWVHVQSSGESVPLAPTPPISPHSQISEGTREFYGGFPDTVPYSSSCGSLMEIVSPTAADHILECALLFKRIKDDGQLVLLTKDTALKIKAMAEGLICESPKEFSGSLLNPFSERFLWVGSTPRGQAWSSYLYEEAPMESFGQLPIRNASKTVDIDIAKGLKLILPHNSH